MYHKVGVVVHILIVFEFSRIFSLKKSENPNQTGIKSKIIGIFPGHFLAKNHAYFSLKTQNQSGIQAFSGWTNYSNSESPKLCTDKFHDIVKKIKKDQFFKEEHHQKDDFKLNEH